MARTSLPNALDELFGLLADTNGVPVASLTALQVAKVYPFEPGASGWVKPCSVTLFPSAIEPTDWTITVRVYVDGTIPPETAQGLLVDVPVAMTDLWTAGYGPDRWQMGWSPELDCYLASADVMVGREDGF